VNEQQVLLALAGILCFGIGAQWLAWRLKLPSILALLLVGMAIGPGLGWLDPDALLGDLLFPAVSIAVAVILFEGGLTLRFSELRRTGQTIRNLVTLGAAVTWLMSAAAAHYLLGMTIELSALLGAILVVTGPTVVLPLLRHVRPSPRPNTVLKWEGIVIDPIGAVLAVLVFEAIAAGGPEEATTAVAASLLRTVLVGAAVGGTGALALVWLLRKRWIPDALDSAVTLALVVAVFSISNVLQSESGLVAATLMGIVVANQSSAAVQHIVEFKENLRVLLISTLFIVLAARLDFGVLGRLGWGSVLFVAWLVFVVRPVAVWLSTLGSPLTWQERLFVAWMAPRGIVAAAIATIFTLELQHRGIAAAEAEVLVATTFLVIVATVALYGLTAAPVARKLGVAQPDPQGVLLLGGHRLSRGIAKTLHELDIPVRIVDSNRQNVRRARLMGLKAHHTNLLSEHALDEIDFSGIGRLLALTPNDEVNSLASLHMVEMFGRSGVFQLAAPAPSSGVGGGSPRHLRGRTLFGGEHDFEGLLQRMDIGAVVKATPITEAFGVDAFTARYGASAVPLFVVDPSNKRVRVVTDEGPLTARPGDVIISLAMPSPEVEAVTGRPADEAEGDRRDARSDQDQLAAARA